MDCPTVSVIVLSYNSREHLPDCFSSLSQLDYPNDLVELVLADNASSDDSVSYVREHFPQVRIIQLDRNYGFCGGNNRAAAMAEGEFVAFLNPDMRVDRHWLAGLVAALGREPEVVCSASKVLTWDGKAVDFGGLLLSFLGHGRADGYQDPDLTAYDHVRYILGPIGGAMLINRKVFLDVGGFDEDFVAYFDDVDLGWRLWILGHKVVLAPQSVCYHVHFGSFSNQPESKMQYLYERNALYTIIKNYEQHYLDQVLPMALLLQIKRAYLLGQLGGTDMDACRFTLEGQKTPAPVTVTYDTRYYLREAWRTLRTDGVTALARKVLDELDSRRRDPNAQSQYPDQARRQEFYYWNQQAHLAAANDVIESYPSLMEKRRYIQGSRRRSDKEIFRTVRALSFDVCFDTPEYRQAQRCLIELFGIEELFGEVFDPEIPFAL